MALVVPIIADTSGLTRGLTQGTSGLRKFARTAALVGVAVGGVLAVGLVKSIRSASDLNEEISKSGVVFGKSADKIQKWSKTTADALGMSERMSLQAASTFALFAKSAGLGGDETVKFSTQMVKLAADLASFNNSTPEESILAIGAALRGENEPIRRFGVLIDDASLRTEALKQGLIETTKDALTPQQKVLAAHALILKQTTTAQGDFERTSGGLANQQRIVKAQIENLSATLGSTFLPIVARAVGAVTSFVSEFSKKPTLTAKIDFVIGKFRDLAWSGIQTISDWWQKTKVTFEDNPGNRLKVTITDSGEEQLNTFFDGIKKTLDKKADTLGKSLGKKIVKAIFGGGTDQATESGDAFINDLLVSLLINKPAFDLGKRFVVAIFDGMREEFNRSLTDNPVSVFIKSLGVVLTPQFGAVGTAAADKLAEAVGTGRKKVVRAITDTVREAVNAARQGLAGLGSTLGGMLSTITGTSSADAKEAARLRKQQKDQQETRERARLTLVRDSAATDEELAQAKQDLADFELEIDASAAEDRVAIAQSANQRSIDALIESFNQGNISAQAFSTGLDAIIGADRGGELGEAFAGAFGRELQSIVSAANDIQSVINKSGRDKLPIAGGMGTPAADAARAAHAEWKSARDARLKTARDARRTKESDGGTKITPAEQKRIDEIMDAYDKKNPEPIRMAAGGILKRQVFTAGEAGREAVIPLGSSEAMGIMRDALGGGRGGATYNLVINAGLGTNPDELGRTIVESIKKFEKRNGQVFAGPQIQATSAGVSTNGGTQTRNLRKN